MAVSISCATRSRRAPSASSCGVWPSWPSSCRPSSTTLLRPLWWSWYCANSSRVVATVWSMQHLWLSRPTAVALSRPSVTLRRSCCGSRVSSPRRASSPRSSYPRSSPCLCRRLSCSTNSRASLTRPWTCQRQKWASSPKPSATSSSGSAWEVSVSCRSSRPSPTCRRLWASCSCLVCSGLSRRSSITIPLRTIRWPSASPTCCRV